MTWPVILVSFFPLTASLIFPEDVEMALRPEREDVEHHPSDTDKSIAELLEETVVKRFQELRCSDDFQMMRKLRSDSDRRLADESCRAFQWRPASQGTESLTSVPTYYISLGTETSDTFVKKYARLFERLHVVEGVWGADPGAVEAAITDNYSTLMEIPTLKAKPGVIGCTLSHLKAIKQAWDNEDDYALILESDVAIDLAPWWPQSLEAFSDLLPMNWEAAQLEWTTYYDNSSAKKYHSNVKGFFINGTSWGTVAYLISRSGMDKVMYEFWSDEANKFDLSKMRTGCPDFTADDCLLGFGEFKHLINWLPGKRPVLEHTFRSVPPRFTSSLGRSLVHNEMPQHIKRSFCDDISASLLDGGGCGTSSSVHAGDVSRLDSVGRSARVMDR